MKKVKLKKLLEAYLSIEKIKLVPSSFDVIGSIAIMEFPEELKKDKKLIAKAMLDVHRNIKTVLEKASQRKSKLRLREYKFLAGHRNTETIHKEYGCIFKLDPTKVYFSPRELTERQRIAEQVKPKEKVLVMFSGIAPYGIVMAKKQPSAMVTCVEINKKAVKYAEENVRLNRLKNVRNYMGNVRKVCPKLGKFNRVVMPLPLEAADFLDIAFKSVKKGGIIHFYNWGEENNLFDNAEKIVKLKAKEYKKKVRIIAKKKVLPYAPRKWKVCLDIKIL
jgi:tRNA (guanine37-N1)-methyltransferase